MEKNALFLEPVFRHEGNPRYSLLRVNIDPLLLVK
jgi:hypothetical protein